MDILIYNITYFIFLLLFSFIFMILFNRWTIFFLVLKFNIPPLVFVVFLVTLQIGIILLFNLILAKYEKIRINKKLFFLIIGLIPFILIFTIVSSFFILKLQLPVLKSIMLFDPIHWFKMGSIIFGFIMYECTYIVYLKNQNGA